MQKLNLVDDMSDEDENIDPDNAPESNENFEDNEMEMSSEVTPVMISKSTIKIRKQKLILTLKTLQKK